MNALRHGSVISQLENDQYDENEVTGREGAEIERAWKRGHNDVMRAALEVLRSGGTPSFGFFSENGIEDAVARARARGWNAGVCHWNVIAGLAELAHAPVIRTVELERAGLDLKLKHALVGGDES
jgi:hypothetical protein